MSAEPGFYLCIDSIGGGTGAVDKLKGAPLQDKEAILAFIGTEFRPYHLDDDSGAAENDPLVISPDEDAGDKRWILSSGVFAGLTLYGNITMPNGGIIRCAGAPVLTFNDTADRLELTDAEFIVGSVVQTGNKSTISGVTVLASHYGQLALMDTSAQDVGVGGAILFGGKYTDAGDYTCWAGVHGAKVNGDTDNFQGELIFYVRAATDVMAKRASLSSSGIFNIIGGYKVDDVQVVSNRVIDARIDDAINSGDATTDGVIDALRDAMITHGLIAAA